MATAIFFQTIVVLSSPGIVKDYIFVLRMHLFSCVVAFRQFTFSTPVSAISTLIFQSLFDLEKNDSKGVPNLAIKVDNQ